MTKKLTPLEKVDRHIARLTAKLSEARSVRAEILAGTLIECLGTGSNSRSTGCNSLMRVADIEYVTVEEYVPPSGCMDGDYWVTRPRGAYFLCPQCARKNPLYDRDDVRRLKDYFGSSRTEKQR